MILLMINSDINALVCVRINKTPGGVLVPAPPEPVPVLRSCDLTQR